ncbi:MULTISPECIES: MurR/RpiR family transcriptional regulator [Listeria]|uniref:MurR/RpiR family transcriptional regulator n=1 Tax=Listeria TaxID=1637 RepID=UPI000B58D574|nr:MULTISPECIES: MurR/RpiR family transcriptional regulator [Listeria]
MILTNMKNMANFTATEKTIATFILKNTDKMELLTIQELAKRTFSSHATIIRFTRKLGLSGFKEFKIALVKEIQGREFSPADVDPNTPFKEGDSLSTISREIMELTQQTVSESFHLLDEAKLAKAARRLHGAERIFLFAVGDSQIRAESFQNKLWKINRYTFLATKRAEWAVHTANMTERDCAVFVSYDAKSKLDLAAAKFLKERAVPIILLTSHTTSELSRLADICISIPKSEDKMALKISTFASQIAFDYVLNVFFAALYQMDYDENKTYLAKNQAFFQENDV